MDNTADPIQTEVLPELEVLPDELKVINYLKKVLENDLNVEDKSSKQPHSSDAGSFSEKGTKPSVAQSDNYGEATS